MVTQAVAGHELPSLTVTQYTPSAKPVANAVVWFVAAASQRKV